MRHSRIGLGALALVMVLAATLLATLAVGASAAHKKTNHPTRAHVHRTTARPMKSEDNGPNGGGTLPTQHVGGTLPFTG